MKKFLGQSQAFSKTFSWSKVATGISSAALFSLVIGISQDVKAAQLSSGWTYSIDAVDDGSGGSVYDIRGLGMSIQNGKVLVALTGGMPLTGTPTPSASDGNIGWGDLIFNFTGKNFSDPTIQGNLFGVHFAATNDSPVPTGVYSNATSTSVTGENDGYSSLQQYYDFGWGAPTNSMGDALSTVNSVLNYFGPYTSPQTSLGSGKKLGEIQMLFASDLAAKGLNFGAAQGVQTFGFSFDASLLPQGAFLAHLFTECANDGIAIAADAPAPAAVPEPTTMAGIALASAGLAYSRKRQKLA